MPDETKLKRLDELIADVGGADDGNHSKGLGGLLLEHLQAARRNLLGTMLGEYSLSLREAEGSVDCIADKGIRTGIRTRLRTLIGDQ